MQIEIDLENRLIRVPSQQIELRFAPGDRQFYLRFIALVAEKTALNCQDGDQRPYIPIRDVEQTLWTWNDERQRRYGDIANMRSSIYQTVRRRMDPSRGEPCFSVVDLEGQRVTNTSQLDIGMLLESQYGPDRAEYRLSCELHVADLHRPVEQREAVVMNHEDTDGALVWTLDKDVRVVVGDLIRANPIIDEALFVAYFGKMLIEALRSIDRDEEWWIQELRLLFRDFGAIDVDFPGEIPNDAAEFAERCQEQQRAMKDLQRYVGKNIGKTVIRYYRGHPCLRGILVKTSGDTEFSAGTLSVYRRRHPGDEIDYSARLSHVIPLNRGHPLTQAMLENFQAWFEFVWEYGSYEKSEVGAVSGGHSGQNASG